MCLQTIIEKPVWEVEEGKKIFQEGVYGLLPDICSGEERPEGVWLDEVDYRNVHSGTDLLKVEGTSSQTYPKGWHVIIGNVPQPVPTHSYYPLKKVVRKVRIAGIHTYGTQALYYRVAPESSREPLQVVVAKWIFILPIEEGL